MTARHSPLDREHRALGAKLVDFGGWQMPLSYETGTIAEHLACRGSVVAFDVSHLGTIRVEGAGAFDRLQRCLTNDLARIHPGQAQYTHLLDEDGSVLDDIIVWWVAADRFDVMPNASNTAPVVEAIRGVDVTDTRAIIAVQGPTARATVAKVSDEAAAVPRFAVHSVHIAGADCIVAGTGYTGEDGVELAVPVDHAAGVWSRLIDAGATPAGLGARDTLRLEAGLPLHGHELGRGITPLQAGLNWVVAWDKGEFRGRAALVAERERGVTRRLRGIVTTGRRPPRQGSDVLIDGKPVGVVTSGNYAPTLECGIALAFLPPETELGADIEVDVRGHPLGGRVVKPPFISK